MSVVHTYTSSDDVVSWVTPSLQVGDVIVMVVGRDYWDSNDPADALPAGFMPFGDTFQIRGRNLPGPNIPPETLTRASWMRVEEAGPVTVEVRTSAGPAWGAGAVLRGATPLTALVGHEAGVRNAQPFDYPALDLADNYTGDVLHIGFHKRSPNREYQIPASDTPVATQEVTSTTVGWVWRNDEYWTQYEAYPNTYRTYIAVGHDTLTGASSFPATTGGERVYGYALTALFADVSGPDAPQIVTPTSGTFDLAGGFTLEWVPSFDPQTGFAVRRKLDAFPWQSWDGTVWVEDTDEIVLDGDATSLAVSGDGVLSDGAVWQYEVATVGGSFRPTLGAWANVTMTATPPPPAPGLTVSDTTGGELQSFMPTVTLTGGPSAGQTLTGYRIEVNQGDYTHTETITTSTPGASWTVPIEVAANFVNDGPWITFSAWTIQNATQVSDPAWQLHTLAVPRPPVPGLTVTPAHHPDSGAPGNLVTVTPAEPITGSFEVARVVDGDSVTIWAGPIGDGWDVLDYLPPSAGHVRYEARVTNDAIAPVVSHWGQSAITTLPHSCGWIIDPLHPDTAVQSAVMSIGEHVSDLRTQALAPLGSRGWVVHAGVPLDQTGTLTVSVEGGDRLAALHSLLTSGARLFVRGWSESGTRDRAARGTALDVWVRLVGEVTVSRPLEGPWATRDVTVSFVTVDPPQWT